MPWDMEGHETFKGKLFRSIAYGQTSSAKYERRTDSSAGGRSSVGDLVSQIETQTRAGNDKSEGDGYLSIFKTLGTGSKTPARPRQGTSNDVIQTPAIPAGVPIHAEEYWMNHKRRGKLLIFNHVTFEGKQTARQGADVDEKALHEQFRKLGFQVVTKTNLRVQEVLATLKAVSKEDHTDADCLAVVVMTHGDPGFLMAFDHAYKEEELWKRFKASKCPSLAGKPKLFFIQACRGDKVDDGFKLTPDMTMTDGPRPKVTYTIPTMADILIAYATFDGHFAFRNVYSGSWFIQALCKELDVNGTRYDLLRIMTAVNRRVAIEYKSVAPSDPGLDNKKQMSNFFSTLTRLVYFKPRIQDRRVQVTE